jgi:hypothetical protein
MTHRQDVDVTPLRCEFEALNLGDTRLERRAVQILEALSASPADSFPEQMESVAEREALYRFFSNPKVTMRALLGAHVDATLARIEGRSVVRVVHDTTAFCYKGDREGLGVLQSGKGFFGHTSLAIAADETREPLGVLALNPYLRKADEQRGAMTPTQRQKTSLAKPREEKETSRWERQAIEVSQLLPPNTRAIHIMDQEADSFDLIGELQCANLNFVIRADPQRRTADRIGADAVLRKSPASLFRSVAVNRRKPNDNRRSHPGRAERGAELEIRWGSITLSRQRHSQSDSAEIVLNAVHVFEPKPPAGEKAIEWMLFTSEPVETLEAATEIVDHYRARWLIEEYFKALKTGCNVESRQLTTFDGLTRALALFIPIAWNLLRLRHLSREVPSRPAMAVFHPEQLLLLRALLKKRRLELPDTPTVRDAMLGIAALGGHIKNNGDPGWLVLGRGYMRFTDAELGWRIASERSDQS